MITNTNYFVGQIDTFLNDEGITQAQLAGSKLCDEDFSHVFSSDLQRARKVSDKFIRIPASESVVRVGAGRGRFELTTSIQHWGSACSLSRSERT